MQAQLRAAVPHVYSSSLKRQSEADRHEQEMGISSGNQQIRAFSHLQYAAWDYAKEGEYVAEAGAIRVTTIQTLLDDIKTRQRIVICDCCRKTQGRARGAISNQLTQAMVTNFRQILKPPEPPMPQRGIWGQKPVSGGPKNLASAITSCSAVLLACSPGQQSYESYELQHGVFTLMLNEALKQPITSGRREITLGMVADSVKARLKAWAERFPHEIMEPSFAEDRQVVGGCDAESWRAAAGFSPEQT